MQSSSKTADLSFPAQWEKLLQHQSTWKWGWGDWQPKKTSMHGWREADFQKEISDLNNRYAYWLGRCPAEGEKTDGFNEVRTRWLAMRIDWVSEQLDQFQMDLAQDGFKPKTPPQENLPFNAQPASTTKRAMLKESGNGLENQPEEPVKLPSPSAASRRPFKPPRKIQKLDLGCDEVFVPGTPDNASPDPLASDDDECTILIE